MPNNVDNNIYCSFCGKPREIVGALIAGPKCLFICDSCVEACNDALHEEKIHSEPSAVNLLKPHEIKA
ncbi:MAG: ATP-dependent Clp protease ATP-binding subunit ClpX, partial [Ruminococcus sp.]|nr:ATP-dependent Clp protease ATP-binding subunit ClpX [Ruminococcus sp.]